MPGSLCILTAYDARFRDVAAISLPGMRRFANAHGYSLRVVEREDCARRGGWIKIEPILECLKAGFEYVLWLDADTLVARIDVDIRTVTFPSAHLYMAWHQPPPQPGGDLPHFNTGVMLIRACDWSRGLFTQVWNAGPVQHRWNDQARILVALGFCEAVGMGPNRPDASSQPIGRLDAAWNSIPDVCAAEDPIIWHYAGMKLDPRVSAMTAKKDELARL